LENVHCNPVNARAERVVQLPEMRGGNKKKEGKRTES